MANAAASSETAIPLLAHNNSGADAGAAAAAAPQVNDGAAAAAAATTNTTSNRGPVASSETAAPQANDDEAAAAAAADTTSNGGPVLIDEWGALQMEVELEVDAEEHQLVSAMAALEPHAAEWEKLYENTFVACNTGPLVQDFFDAQSCWATPRCSRPGAVGLTMATGPLSSRIGSIASCSSGTSHGSRAWRSCLTCSTTTSS